MNKLSRLSELNIEDDVLRGIFYRSIIQYVNDPTAILSKVIIRQNEEFRPDLVSYRLYGIPDLRWLVCLICGVEDEADPLPVASEFYFPSSIWVRQQLRKFINELGL